MVEDYLTRAIDELGRIVIPIQMLKCLGASRGSLFDVTVEEGRIILTLHREGTPNKRMLPFEGK